jgi:hypothetical protein
MLMFQMELQLQGDLAALYFEKAPGDDAFHQPIKIAMEAKMLTKEGFTSSI